MPGVNMEGAPREHKDIDNLLKVIQSKTKSQQKVSTEKTDNSKMTSKDQQNTANSNWAYIDSQIEGSNVTVEEALKQKVVKAKNKKKTTGNKTKKDKENKSNNDTKNKTAVNEKDDDNDKRNKNNKNVDKKTKKKRKNRKNRRLCDRFYGKFTCPICHNYWESSHVYTVPGTFKVLFQQRCQKCKDGWVFPWDLQLLRCGDCLGQPNECICECEDCGLLIHHRWEVDDAGYMTDTIDESVHVCECDGSRRKTKRAGVKGDPKKPHRGDLCQKCIRGRPCVQGNHQFENEP